MAKQTRGDKIVTKKKETHECSAYGFKAGEHHHPEHYLFGSHRCYDEGTCLFQDRWYCEGHLPPAIDAARYKAQLANVTDDRGKLDEAIRRIYHQVLRAPHCGYELTPESVEKYDDLVHKKTIMENLTRK